MTWIAYCFECRKEIDRALNGQMVEAQAQIHNETTGHLVIVGYEVNKRLMEEEMEVAHEKR